MWRLVGVGRIELPTSCSQSRRPTAGLHPDVSEFTTPVGGGRGGEPVSQETNRLRPAGMVNVICQINEATVLFTLFSHPSRTIAIVGLLPRLTRLCKQIRVDGAGLGPPEGT